MKKLTLLAAVLVVVPLMSQTTGSPYSSVHTVFVKGNSEAAAAMRKELLRQTDVFPKHKREVCLSLSQNEKQADAVLDIDEQTKLGGLISDAGVTASGTLTNQQGDLLWSDAKSFGNGFVNSGAGSAAQRLLLALEKKVCPKWHHV